MKKNYDRIVIENVAAEQLGRILDYLNQRYFDVLGFSSPLDEACGIVEGKLAEALADNALKAPCNITVVRDDRAYGGPEEGGWWYNTREIVEKFNCLTQAEAEARLAQLTEKYIGVSEHDVNSVLSEGVYTIFVGQEIPEEYPTERPHYE